MTDRELCTQYELLLALMRNGLTDEAVRILEEAIARIKGEDKGKSDKQTGGKK